MKEKPKQKVVSKAYNCLLHEERVLRELQTELEEQLFTLQIEECTINSALMELKSQDDEKESPMNYSNSLKKDSKSVKKVPNSLKKVPNSLKKVPNSLKKVPNSLEEDSDSPCVKRILRSRSGKKVSGSSNAKGKTISVKGKSPDNKKTSDPETSLLIQQMVYNTRSKTQAAETTLKSCKTRLEPLDLEVEGF